MLCVTHCLCCIRLRPAGIILGIIGIVFPVYVYIFEVRRKNNKISDPNDLYSIRVVNSFTLVSLLLGIEVITNIFWIIGILKDNRKLMLLELIRSFLFVLECARVSLIFALVDPFGLRTNERARKLKESFRPWTPISFYCLTGVFIYLWIVRLSLYKSMAKNDRNEDTNHDRTVVYTI